MVMGMFGGGGGGSLGSAWWEVGLRSDKLKQGLQETKQELTQAGNQAEQGFFGRIRQGASRVLGPLGTMKGAIAGLGAAYAGSQVIGFFNGAIQAAGDLAETTSKAEVVFGSTADEVLAMGKDAARGLGMSEEAALAAAGTYGNLFRAMGITEQASADMSIGLVQLAADLASFNNMDPTEVLDKLRAGLSGETEPLRTLGVNLNQARIEAKALEMGLWDGVGAIDAAAKAQATYSLILEDTTLAQGDFARTSEGLANQQRIMEAQLADTTASIGQGLLPIMVALVGFVNDVLVPALNFLMEWGIGPIGEGIGKVVGAFQGARDVIQDFAMGMGDMGDRIREASERYGVAFDELRDRVQARMAETGETFDVAMTHIEDEMRAASVTVPATATELMAATNAAFLRGERELLDEWDATVEQVPQKVRDRWDDTRAAAYQTMVEYARGLLDAQDEPKVAMDALMQAQEDALTEQAEINRLLGQLNSQELANGLNDKRPAVRAAAQAARQVIEDRLRELGAWNWGNNLGSSYAAGIANSVGVVRTAAGQLAAAATGQIGIRSEPSDPTSPLRGITRWGGNLVHTYAEGILGALGHLRQAAQTMASVASLQGQASFEGGGLPLQAAQAAMGGLVGREPLGGVQVHFTYAPQLSTASPAEIEQMRRVVADAVTSSQVRRAVVTAPPVSTY